MYKSSPCNGKKVMLMIIPCATNAFSFLRNGNLVESVDRIVLVPELYIDKLRLI